MSMRIVRGLAAAVLMAWARPASAQAQSASVLPVQSLSFGLLLPGVPEVVSLSDVARRAVVAMTGSGPVDVTLVLPDALTDGDGNTIPLRFRSSDAGILPSVAGGVVPVNPFQVNRVQLEADRAVHFLLGGSAHPARTQRAGRYAARVVMIVTQPGT